MKYSIFLLHLTVALHASSPLRPGAHRPHRRGARRRGTHSIPYKPKTNAIETWFSQFKHHLIQKQGKGVTFRHLKNTIKTVIASIDSKSYTNIMKYAYKNKDNRKTIRKVSTRRRKSKQYIS